MPKFVVVVVVGVVVVVVYWIHQSIWTGVVEVNSGLSYFASCYALHWLIGKYDDVLISLVKKIIVFLTINHGE